MSRTATTEDVVLPNEIIEIIVFRLSVKSLIRLRSVSKFFYSIITNPTFITKHFKLNLKQSELLVSTNGHPGNLLYTTQNKNSSPSSKRLCTVARNSDSSSTQISRCEIPSIFEKHGIVGFCNGLICLASCDNELKHIIYLWNPSIRKFKELRATPFTDENNEKLKRSVVGLAYNSQNNDFKILRLLSAFIGPGAEAEIYSLSTDSWRRVAIPTESLVGNGINYGGIDNDDPTCIFLNGALHTVAAMGRHRFILSFDVNDEIFRQIMLPFNQVERVTKSQLALFKGSLAFVTFASDLGAVSCDIWVRKENGVARTWSKTYRLKMSWVWDVKRDVNFYGCTDNGELLIKSATGWISIDPESGNKNIIAIEDADWVGFMANSMESLLLLDGE